MVYKVNLSCVDSIRASGQDLVWQSSGRQCKWVVDAHNTNILDPIAEQALLSTMYIRKVTFLIGSPYVKWQNLSGCISFVIGTHGGRVVIALTGYSKCANIMISSYRHSTAEKIHHVLVVVDHLDRRTGQASTALAVKSSTSLSWTESIKWERNAQLKSWFETATSK